MIESNTDNRFLEFNNKYWDILSNIVLKIYQFLIVAHEEAKKDKKKERKQPFVKGVDPLLTIIYKIARAS
ncbi:hypothetical protein NBO_22g0012 [Nosema bombycis CQ1]|uniref:Uncharacterized protein n=1 Tax=Nosema bombycis (strain CQ1 / CVCC 102059) TaxID=578461 RepID=R0MK44_NOSB1|nr:hypothetical protein NBO_22g0012 [Nosema bombycis CQ1]|eukprot:EOB14610.1 hypothetical protein NBO_22g0012 [Nosema bombycis CQ1]